MTRPEYNQVWDSLLLVANRVSPTGKEQAAFVKLKEKIIHSQPHEEQDYDNFKQFIGAIYDGVAHGNWPT